MADIQIFNNPEFGSIRSIEQNGEPWFVGKDVALALGYKDTVNALKSHVDEQDKAGWRITTQFGEKETTIINESGVYSLIFSSKLEGAQRFKRWVTSEVLPSIRRTGCYGTPDLSELSPELRCLIRLEQQQKQQAQELVRLNQKLDQLQGMSKTRAGRLTKMDAIAASSEPVERWLKILHEMEARYCTAAPEKE